MVELVTATMILVIVVGSTTVLLRSVFGARERIQRQMELQQQARSAADSIAVALRNAFRTANLDHDGLVLEGIDAWNGDMPADRIRFFSIGRRTIRQGQPESDLREVEFRLAIPQTSSADDLPILVRRTDPTRNLQPDGGGVVENIVDNCIALDISYHDGFGWQQNWPNSRRSWPLAIQVQMMVLGEAREGKSPPMQPITRLINFPHAPRTEDGGGNQ